MEETEKKTQLLNLPAPPSSSIASNENNINGSADHEQPAVRIDKGIEDYFKSLPPGYRFCPTDIELIVHYLDKKIKNEILPLHRIYEVNLYKYSPDIISEMYPVIGEKEWYFFTPRSRKYSNGTRPNRAAGTGYWKATGADKPIKDNDSTIGFRKSLVFYEGKPLKGQKSNWIMHEYRANAQPRKKSCANDMRLDDYVLCRIYKKIENLSKSQTSNEDEEQNDHLDLISSPIDDHGNHVQAYNQNDDSHYLNNYYHQVEDYSQLQIPHLHCEYYANMSSAEEEIAKFNNNLFQSYGLGQQSLCFMPSINPMIMSPLYSTSPPNNVADIDTSFLDHEVNLDTIPDSPSNSFPVLDKKDRSTHMQRKRKI